MTPAHPSLSACVCLLLSVSFCSVSGPQRNASAQAATDWKEQLSKHTTTTGDDMEIGYRLYEPADPKPGESYPLVLFLHGAGERGDDNEAQLKHGVSEFMQRQAEYPCFLLVPQCPKEKRWVEADWSEASGRNTFPEAPSEPLKAILNVLNGLLDSKAVDRNRIYVTGLSMGGYGTWFASGSKQDLFAAAAPICGGGDPSWANRYVQMPLWTFHGDNDRAVPVQRSREMIEAIEAAGGSPKYTEYPGVGHDSWTATYASDEFHAWLFSHRKQ